MATLADLIHDYLNTGALSTGPGHRVDTPDMGSVYSSGAYPSQEASHSIAALRNMRAAEEEVAGYHRALGKHDMNYPNYHPEILRDFSPRYYSDASMDNTKRNIDSLDMDLATGPFNDIKNRDAKQVLLGIAESMYRNQNPSSTRRDLPSTPPGHDMEITIKKKMHKQAAAPGATTPNPFDNRMIRSKPQP